jgi:hypothetical protein
VRYVIYIYIYIYIYDVSRLRVKSTDTYSEYVVLIFTATMETRTPLKITLHLSWLSCQIQVTFPSRLFLIMIVNNIALNVIC